MGATAASTKADCSRIVSHQLAKELLQPGPSELGLHRPDGSFGIYSKGIALRNHVISPKVHILRAGNWRAGNKAS